MKKTAFTLIEMMISISILSIMMIFLYQSNSALNFSNKTYKKESKKILTINKIREILYLDISLAIYKSIKIKNQDKNSDIVFFQTSHSLHRRFNPYVAYIFKESTLYRVESLKPFKSYPITEDGNYDIDIIKNIKKFRFYKSQKKEIYLTDIEFKNSNKILMKIITLNEL